jgi:preprotein translocase subunit SecF
MRMLQNANYDFISRRKAWYIFSVGTLLIGMASLLIRGVETGIDFRGGTEIVVNTSEDAPPVGTLGMRQTLAPVLGEDPEVKEFGGSRSMLVRTTAGGDIDALQRQVVTAVTAAYPESAPTIERTDIVGPRFAEDLKRGAILSVLFGLLVIFVYVMVRFEWTYSVGAVATLAHDVLFTLGLFSLLQGVVPFSLTVDQTIIAAFLTILGYSINDTVIVFDRMREYTLLFKSEPIETIVNRSINSTLSRTIITSGTTVMTTLVLFLFAGDVIRPFAFALFVGIGVGTYSSIAVAAPIVYELKRWQAGRRRRPVLARA